MNIKNIYKRLMSIVLTFILITGCIGLDGRPVLAATTSVYLTSLGSKGTVLFCKLNYAPFCKLFGADFCYVT